MGKLTSVNINLRTTRKKTGRGKISVVTTEIINVVFGQNPENEIRTALDAWIGRTPNLNEYVKWTVDVTATFHGEDDYTMVQSRGEPFSIVSDEMSVKDALAVVVNFIVDFYTELAPSALRTAAAKAAKARAMAAAIDVQANGDTDSECSSNSDVALVQGLITAPPGEPARIRKPQYVPGSVYRTTVHPPAISGIPALFHTPVLPPRTVRSVWTDALDATAVDSSKRVVRIVKMEDVAAPEAIYDVTTPSNLDCVVTTHKTAIAECVHTQFLELANLAPEAKKGILGTVPANDAPHICAWIKTSWGSFLNPDGDDIDDKLSDVGDTVARLFRKEPTSKLLFFVTVNCYTQQTKDMIVAKMAHRIFNPLAKTFPTISANFVLFAEFYIENVETLFGLTVKNIKIETVAAINPRLLIAQPNTSVAYLHVAASV